jgi:CubicO group peptidase (beta-lactamase class C family)
MPESLCRSVPFALAVVLAIGCGSPASSPDAGDVAPASTDVGGASGAADAASDGGVPGPQDVGANAGSDASAAADASLSGPDTGYQPTQQEAAAFQRLLSKAQTRLTETNSPGASVAIVLHGQLAFAAGVGLRNVAASEPVTTATRFHVASMSKMVVAATTLSLMQDGKVDLAAPITQYLPWFKLKQGDDASTLTLSLLLSHSSGFPSDTIPLCGDGGPRQAYLAANPQPLWYPPGGAYDYSNAGFVLAAAVLEAAAGVSDGQYEQLAHDRVFAPAGMTTATFDTATAEAQEHATGYELDSTGKVTGTFELTAQACPFLNPPGGILATASDYASFAIALLSGGDAMLQPSSVALMEAGRVDMHQMPTDEYCYGLRQQYAPPYDDHLSVWHDGKLSGFTSEMWMIPDQGFAVVALVNASGGAYGVPDRIVSDALDFFLGFPRANPSGTTDPSTWAGYAGTYDDALGTLGTGVVISVSGGGDAGAASLDVKAPNSVTFSGAPAPVKGGLEKQKYDTWTMPDGTEATFFPGASGTPRYLVSRRGVAVKE